MHFEKQTLKFCPVSATLKIFLIQTFYPEFSGIEARTETLEKCSILLKFKEGENFNHRNTFSILRIKLKLHCVQNVEPDTEIG